MHDLEIKTNKRLYLLTSHFFYQGSNYISIATNYKDYNMSFSKKDDGYFYKEKSLSMEPDERLIYIKNSRDRFLYEKPFVHIDQITKETE